MRASLETLFVRFRDRGDLKALAKVFDRTARDLLNVAHHLVQDPSEAEDVLQQTFACAIERAGSFDARKSLIPWLTGILARQAAEMRRRSARIVEPDRLSERRPVPDPADRTLQAELQSSVHTALGKVPELYRGVLVPLLEDGKRPEEIAQELGRAPGTVRMQIHRGLDLLRRALPAGISAAVIGTTVPRGLAAVRVAVLEQAAAAAGIGAASVASLGAGSGLGASLLAGGWVVSKNAWLAGVGITLATGTAWLWMGAGAEGIGATRGPGTREVEEVARLEGPVAQLGDEAGAIAEQTAPEQASDRTTATAPGVWLVGNVTGVLPEHAPDVSFSAFALKNESVAFDALNSQQPWLFSQGRDQVSIARAMQFDSRDSVVSGVSLDLATPLITSVYSTDETAIVSGSPGIATGHVAPDGRVEYDLTDYVEAYGGWEEFLKANLAVRLDHEVYMPLSEQFPVVDLTRASSFEDGVDRIELHVDLDLRPAAVLRGKVAASGELPLVNRIRYTDSAIDLSAPAELEQGTFEITARVLDADGEDFEASSGALVWAIAPMILHRRTALLFELLGGRLGERPVSEIRVEHDGKFEFKVPVGGTYALAVLDADRRPISRFVELELRSVVELEEELAFPETYALAGFVDDHGLAQGRGIEVRAERVPGPQDQKCSSSEVELLFDGVDFELTHHSLMSESDGGFEFERLAPGMYELDAGGLSGAVALYEPSDEERVMVSAPGAGVALELRGALVELAFTIDGRPPTDEERQRFALTLQRERDGARTDLNEELGEEGRVLLLVEPGQNYGLEANGPAIQRGETSFEAPEQGTGIKFDFELESPL